MKRSISAVMTIVLLLLLNSCSNESKMSRIVKIGVIDSCLSDKMVQELDIKEYNKISVDVTNDNITHGSIITKIIQQEIENCDIYYYSIYDEICRGTIESVTSAISKCIEDEVDIISMSFARLKDDERIKAMIEGAQKKGIIIVASCFNLSDKKCYPAMYDNVISVTDGFNQNATINLKGKIVQVKICGEKIKKSEVSFLTAYVSGVIARRISEGTAIDVIINNTNLF